MKILISIKPIYAHQIFSGEKLYEFRRAIWKRNDIDTVVVYSSYPEKKVIGEFTIDKIIYDTPKELFKLREECPNAEEQGFMDYYNGKENGYAIKVKNPILYEVPKSLSDFDVKTAPQNFVYVL